MKLNRNYLRRLINEAVLNEEDVRDRIINKVMAGTEPSQSDISNLSPAMQDLINRANQEEKVAKTEIGQALKRIRQVDTEFNTMPEGEKKSLEAVTKRYNDALSYLSAGIGKDRKVPERIKNKELTKKTAKQVFTDMKNNPSSDFQNTLVELENMVAVDKAMFKDAARKRSDDEADVMRKYGKKLNREKKTERIQRLLNTLLDHYEIPTISEDGKWGKKTDKALLKVMTHGGSWARGKKKWKDAANDSGGKYKPTMNGLIKFLQDEVEKINSQTEPSKKKNKVDDKTDGGASGDQNKNAEKKQKELQANKAKLRKLLDSNSFANNTDNSKQRALINALSDKNVIVSIHPFNSSAIAYVNDDIRLAGGKVTHRAITDDNKFLVAVGENQLNESLRMSRGSLYRRRYRRY